MSELSFIWALNWVWFDPQFKLRNERSFNFWFVNFSERRSVHSFILELVYRSVHRSLKMNVVRERRSNERRSSALCLTLSKSYPKDRFLRVHRDVRYVIISTITRSLRSLDSKKEESKLFIAADGPYSSKTFDMSLDLIVWNVRIQLNGPNLY